MNITVIGTGYVGLVTGTCFADVGHSVCCVDSDARKIEGLCAGRLPIYEPGLQEMVLRSHKAGRLQFTTDLAAGVRASELIFIAVGTPPMPDGSVDLSYVRTVAEQIGRSMDGYKVIVGKSTVPVGTGKMVSQTVRSVTDHPFAYVSNPEFLKEGAAVNDFTMPARIVIGSESPEAIETLKQAYMPFMRKSERFIVMDTASAEMTKYAANTMLALRISFMNEVANLCEAVGADAELVRRGVGTDTRIGGAFLFPGVGYGGSCFPKDVQGLSHLGESAGVEMAITEAVHDVNRLQRERFARRVLDHFGPAARHKTVAVWGLAYKARTDDTRESPAVWCVQQFLEAGMRVRAHDPEAMDKAAGELGPGVTMTDDPYDALDGADALVVMTDWQEFRGADLDRVAQRLAGDTIIDGRNLYDPEKVAEAGLWYASVGRADAEPTAATRLKLRFDAA